MRGDGLRQLRGRRRGAARTFIPWKHCGDSREIGGREHGGMSRRSDIVVVGGGIAGQAVVEAVRDLGRYVERKQIPKVFGEKDAWSAWTHLRPLSLNLWLRSNAAAG